MVGIDQQLLRRRVHEGNLSRGSGAEDPVWVAVWLRNLTQLLEHRRASELLPRMLRHFLHPSVWRQLHGGESALLERARTELLDALERAAEARPQQALASLWAPLELILLEMDGVVDAGSDRFRLPLAALVE